jgi:plastocyanin domain-containing protein
MKYASVSAAVLVLSLFSLGLSQEATGNRAVATIGPDGVQHMDVTGGAYYFDPNVIVVKVNIPVELVVKKAGGIIPHNIVLKAPEAGINISVALRSKPTLIMFTPTKVGKYTFVCTKRLLFFKSHEARGMHGILEVVE